MSRIDRPRRYIRKFIVGAIMLQALGCEFRVSLASDATLEQNFRQYQAEYTALLADVEEDPKLNSFGNTFLNYGGHLITLDSGSEAEIEKAGLSRERWSNYKHQLKKLGLAGGVFKDGDRVEFRVDKGIFGNGDSYKGYEFNRDAPMHLHPSLDGYRISEEDKDGAGNWIARKRLGQHWYLYLFINH